MFFTWEEITAVYVQIFSVLQGRKLISIDIVYSSNDCVKVYFEKNDTFFTSILVFRGIFNQ